MSKRQVAAITQKIINILSLNCQENTPIYLGDSNITHMRTQHPKDYAKFCPYIEDILTNPEYVGINPTDNSIEYVREFELENEYVKIAVRISLSGNYFARSLYTLNSNRVHNFIAKGTLKKVD